MDNQVGSFAEGGPKPTTTLGNAAMLGGSGAKLSFKQLFFIRRLYYSIYLLFFTVGLAFLLIRIFQSH